MLYPIIQRHQRLEASSSPDEENRRFLIIQSDDFGLSPSVNRATSAAFEAGALTSVSIMVPCPAFAEAASYAGHHPELSVGIHLTLTSEWPTHRWGPLSPPGDVPSIVNGRGLFFPSAAEFSAHARAIEVEIEIRRQIETALSSGLNPSHIDTHMFALFENAELYSVYRNLSQEYGLPFLAPIGSYFSGLAANESDSLIDEAFIAYPGLLPEKWTSSHISTVQKMSPGITQLIVHVGFDDQGLRTVMGENSPWGAAWRQRDFDVLTSVEFKRALKMREIELINWRDLGFRVR
jgi:chitin disaccharide deacetylase